MQSPKPKRKPLIRMNPMDIILSKRQEKAEHAATRDVENPTPVTPRTPLLQQASLGEEYKRAGMTGNKKFRVPILKGVQELDCNAYKELLEREVVNGKGDVNARDMETGVTALHVAAKYGKHDILSLLLQIGADCNAQDKSYQTPLHIAIQHGHDECSWGLLSCRELKINNPDNNLETPLHFAARKGSEEATRWILALAYETKDIKLSFINAKNKNGSTSLHIAAQENKVAALKLLLESGADRGIPDKGRYLPLHYVAEKGYSECCQLLLSDIDYPERKSHIEFPTKDGKLPLLLAAKKGFRKCCELMKCGNMNVRDKKTQDTALHFAIREGFSNTVSQLLEDGADPNLPNRKGNTAIHEAINHGRFDCLEILVEKGVALNILGEYGKNVLHLAAEQNLIRVLEFILRSPSMQNILPDALMGKDKSQFTPLHLAIKNKCEECALVLLENGASPIHQASGGMTPLHLAADGGCLGVCEFLLSKPDVEVNQQDKRSKATALHLAAHNGSETICRFLVRKGAQLNAKDQDGRNALHIASAKGHADIIKFLLKRGVSPREVDNNEAYPLHLAASCGSLESCKALVDHTKDICSKEDQNGDLPLDRAFKDRECSQDHEEVFRYLVKSLRYKENQDKLMLRIHDYMKTALDEGREIIVRAITESAWWKGGIIGENGHHCRNFRRLIKDYPPLAVEYMKNCIYTDKKGSDIIYDFTPLEDNYYIPPTNQELAIVPYHPRTHKLLPDALPYQEGLEWKENHPVTIMMDQECLEMMYHPLIKEWLREKWRTHIRWIFLVLLLLHILFTLTLTFFMGLVSNWVHVNHTCLLSQREFCDIAWYRYLVKEDREEMRLTTYTRVRTQMHSFDNDVNFDRCNKMVDAKLALWSFLLIFTLLTIALEVNNIYRLRGTYFRHREHFLQILKIIVTLIVLIPWGACDFIYATMNVVSWMFGVLDVLIAWFHLIIVLNQVPGLAVFMPISGGFLRSFFVVLFYISAIIFTFAFMFHLLLSDHDPFRVIPQAMVKTTVWMLGDLAYDDTFLSEGRRLHYPILTNLLFVLFVALLGGLLAHLIITQPSSKLENFRHKATFYKVGHRTELFLRLDVCFPCFLRNTTVGKCITSAQSTRENVISRWFQSLFMLDRKDKPDSYETMDPIQVQLQEMQQMFTSSAEQNNSNAQEIKEFKLQLTKLARSQFDLKESVHSLERLIKSRTRLNILSAS